MSLRHMEDLKKIRPVVLFLIENYGDIFSVIRSYVKSTTFEPKVNPSPVVETVETERKLSDMMASAMVIDVPSKADESKAQDDANNFSFVKPNLLVMIPTLQTSEISTPCDVEVEGDKMIVAPFQPYSDTEWKVSLFLSCFY